MKAFRVYLNGKRISTAGVGDFGVLTAFVTWVRRESSGTLAKRRPDIDEELELSVGGLISSKGEHVKWVDHNLEVGDEVRIKVVHTDSIDPPRSRYCPDPARDLRTQKRYVREMAKRFGWTIQAQR